MNAHLTQAGAQPSTGLRARWTTALDLAVIGGFCAFFFYFGLGALGLVGADEPRYAQIAREMLARHDWVTPVLNGKPWLEKPVLYYWQAMLAYSVFGVSDWAARLPGAVSATALVVAVYLFARRYLRVVALDAALIVASSAFMIGFGHAASTDTPLAATLGIGLLCWIGWYLSSEPPGSWPQRLPLTAFYVFLALATLAKGPVAPFLAALILVVFALLRRDLRLLGRTLWLPGIALYLALALPWYVLVQRSTGNFFRVFILEHNLQRYGTTVYHHPAPFWYFAPVVLAAVLPWTVLAVAGIVRAVSSGLSRREDPADGSALNLFLALWALLPVIFFSFSGSKLPGYILPVVPAWGLLAAVYLREKLMAGERPHRLLVLLHALLAGAILGGALAAPHLLLRMRPPREAVVIAALAGAVLFAVVAITLHRAGMRMLRFVTLLSMVLALVFLLRFAAPALDAQLTSRPVAQALRAMAPPDAVIVGYNMPRELEYGLAFYRNRAPLRWEMRQGPASDYLLMARNTDAAKLAIELGPDVCRRALGSYPSQGLTFYWIAACPEAARSEQPSSRIP